MTIRKQLLGICFGVLGLSAAACSAPIRKPEAPVYFPPAPQLPRVQFLVSFTGLRDIEQQSAFNRFVVGEKRDLRVDKPYGIGIHDGRIYVCDTNAGVFIFDMKRRAFESLKGAVGPGKLMQPQNISIEPDGTKYITDPPRGQVVVFDRNDEYVRAYGSPGAWRPVDAVPFEERLFVADVQHGLVRVFDKQSGEMLARTIGDKGAGFERLDRPTNLAFDAEGYLYVTDVGRMQVLKFDRDGHYKGAFGRPGDNIGHFARPKGIAVDREGRLFSADASFNNVQIFNKEGRILMFFGEGVEKPGALLLPAKVTIDYDNLETFRDYVEPNFEAESLVLVTSQFGERRVNVFAFGRQKGASYPSDAELMKQIDELRKKEREKLESR